MSTSTIPLDDSRKERDSLLAALPGLNAAILEEYPGLTADQVEPLTSNSKLDELVQTISTETGHTRKLVRKQLGELAELSGDASTDSSEATGVSLEHLLARANDALARVEAKSKEAIELAQKLPDELSETGRKAKSTVEDNVWISLLCALGLGVLIGILVKSRK